MPGPPAGSHLGGGVTVIPPDVRVEAVREPRPGVLADASEQVLADASEHRTTGAVGRSDDTATRPGRGTTALVVDVAIVLASVAVPTLVLRDQVVQGPASLLIVAALVATWVTAVVAEHIGRRPRVASAPVSSVLRSAATAGLTVCVLAVLLHGYSVRPLVFIAIPSGVALMLGHRFLHQRWSARHDVRAGEPGRVLLVVSADRARSTLDVVEASLPGSRVIAVHVVDDRRPQPGLVDELPDGVAIVPSGVDLGAAVQAVAAELVLISPETPGDVIERISWQVADTSAALAIAFPLGPTGPHRLPRPSAGQLPLFRFAPATFRGPRFAAKRLFDIAGAGLALGVLSPVMIVIAVAVRVSSPGPVLYRQERIGRDERPFMMLKFRSMVEGAHGRLAEVLRAEGVESIGVFYKPKNDPRVTPLGRFLRAHSLDELPQLINVLRGDMSLVGPRPQIAAEVALYDDRTRRRLLVKPGCTGLWQVSGRSNLGPSGIAYDLDYADNWTLRTDFSILLRTLRVILLGDGAY